MAKDTNLEVDSIDQILEKIKKAIESDTKEIGTETVNNDILELTNVVPREKTENLDLVSQTVQDFTRKLNLLMQGNYVLSEKEIKEIFKETLRPYLKSWLNNNIKSLAKEVVETEVKRMLEKIT